MSDFRELLLLSHAVVHRWPHGAAALQARVERFTAAFREVAGGEQQAAQLLEFVGLDTERGMGVWGSYRTSSSDAACARRSRS